MKNKIAKKYKILELSRGEEQTTLIILQILNLPIGMENYSRENIFKIRFHNHNFKILNRLYILNNYHKMEFEQYMFKKELKDELQLFIKKNRARIITGHYDNLNFLNWERIENGI